VWTGFSWLGVVSSGGSFDNDNEPTGCIIPLLAWQLSASGGGLCSVRANCLRCTFGTAVWMTRCDLQLLIVIESRFLIFLSFTAQKFVQFISCLTTGPISRLTR
jgi:hypothetical protein